MQSQEDERMTPELRWLGAIMAFGGFASLLDATIINVAIGPLATVFSAPISTVQWTVTCYLLAITATLPLSAWTTARFGAKQTILFSQIVFMVGSVLCGLAWSAPTLIVFRIIQGIGGGLAVPVGQALLAQAAGPKRLSRLMSVVTMPALFAPLIGPSLGGILIDHLSWRWIFFINVPFCLVTILLVTIKVRNVVAPSSTAKLDALGLVLLVPGVTALIYGLTEAGSASRSVGVAVASLVIGVVLSVAFVLHALRARSDSLLDLRLFGVPAFRVGTVANFLFSMAMYGVLIPLPLYFQLVRGSTVLESALALLPQSLGYLMAVMVLNRLSAVLGVRYLTLLGTLLVIVGSVPFALITAESNRILLTVALVVRGMGLGAAMMPTMTVAFASVDRERAPSATAAFNVFQRVGASLGTAVIAIVLQNQMSDRLPAGTSNFSQVKPGGGTAHALASAFNAPFWWAIAFTVLALVPAFLLPGRQEAPIPQRVEEPALQPE